MREIVLDTETTGLDPEQGDRIVEIGAVELWNHMPTGETWQEYINPQRSMPSDAFRMHGIGADLLDPPQVPEPGAVTLKDKPIFERIAQAFLDFVGDSRLVIHNVEFDLKFLNAELVSANLPEIPREQAIDTLYMARRKYPGAPASLDALRRRFDIDRSRALHGALQDSMILAEVYLELIGGRQPDFGLSRTVTTTAASVRETWRPTARPNPLPSRITKEEATAHANFVAGLGDGALWKRFCQETG